MHTKVISRFQPRIYSENSRAAAILIRVPQGFPAGKPSGHGGDPLGSSESGASIVARERKQG